MLVCKNRWEISEWQFEHAWEPMYPSLDSRTLVSIGSPLTCPALLLRALAHKKSIGTVSRRATLGDLGAASLADENHWQLMPFPMLRFSTRSIELTLFSLRGGPDYQCRFKDDGSSARSLFGLKQTEDKLGRVLAKHIALLIDARQGNTKAVVIG